MLQLEQACAQPVNESIDHTGAHTVDDYRAGDGEHFGGGAQDAALCMCPARTLF